jgi:2-polyprenyl-3-methyl-5-hydroxy-6-metoxy-1,4-benzoquinol methylase
MTASRIVVQASSRSWQGGRDQCMNEIDGRPAVAVVLDHVRQHFDCPIVLAGPEFDAGGELAGVAAKCAGGGVTTYFGHNERPLHRVLAACQDLDDNALIVRVDGLHVCVDLDGADAMLELAEQGALDCVKFPDDFPAQVACEVFRIGALRRAAESLGPADAPFWVHPKFYLFAHPHRFRTAYYEPARRYTDEELRTFRRRVQSVHDMLRIEVGDQRVWHADQLSFHYELAAERLDRGARVLDVACGDGFGCRMMAPKAREMVGVDLDPSTINAARGHAVPAGVRYEVGDVTRLGFPDGYFDAVTSMETLEHVSPEPTLRELVRVLRPGGRLMLSTPQNRIGHIPVNAAHVHEYSVDELRAVVQPFAEVEEIIGIKAGRIVFAGDPIGANTFLTAIKRQAAA